MSEKVIIEVVPDKDDPGLYHIHQSEIPKDWANDAVIKQRLQEHHSPIKELVFLYVRCDLLPKVLQNEPEKEMKLEITKAELVEAYRAHSVSEKRRNFEIIDMAEDLGVSVEDVEKAIVEEVVVGPGCKLYSVGGTKPNGEAKNDRTKNN
jgi:hypothetical protein